MAKCTLVAKKKETKCFAHFYLALITCSDVTVSVDILSLGVTLGELLMVLAGQLYLGCGYAYNRVSHNS